MLVALGIIVLFEHLATTMITTQEMNSSDHLTRLIIGKSSDSPTHPTVVALYSTLASSTLALVLYLQ